MSTTRALAALFAVATMTLAGCGGSDGGGTAEPQSPITNEDVPAMDMAKLPDIDATNAQMLELLDRVLAEVTRLVPASAPWKIEVEASFGGCKRDGQQGVT